MVAGSSVVPMAVAGVAVGPGTVAAALGVAVAVEMVVEPSAVLRGSSCRRLSC